jgi:drug/metabolite transporter (DMT)-like permease
MSSSQIPSSRIYLALFTGIICISSSAIFVKYLESRGLPLLGVAFFRMLLTIAILAPWTIIKQTAEIQQFTRQQWLLLIGSGLFLALHFGTWTVSLNYIPVARSVLLVTCHPIFTVLISWLLLAERPSPRTLLAIMAALMGVIVIMAESLSSMRQSTSLIGDLLALTGAVTIVGYLIIGKQLRHKMSLASYTGIVYSICAGLLFLTCWILQVNLQQFQPNDYIFLAALALIPTLGGHTIFNFLLKQVSPTLVSLAFLGEPLGASLLALLIWRQVPSPYTLGGGALIIGGIYLSMSAAPTPTQTSPPSETNN